MDENMRPLVFNDHYPCDEDYDLFEHDESIDDNFFVVFTGLSVTYYQKELKYPVNEYKEEHILDEELQNKNRYSAKVKSHSLTVSSIRESVHHCTKVLGAIVDGDYKVVLNAFKPDSYEFCSTKLFAAMCLHHVSSLSYIEKLNICNLLDNLLECFGRNTTEATNDYSNYLDIFFRHLCAKRCFDLISRIWHLYLDIENALKYSFCKKLLKIESPQNKHFICANIKNLAYLWKTDYMQREDSSLLLSLLHYAVTSDQIDDVKLIKSIIVKHMDSREIVEAYTSYVLVHWKTAKLLSWSKLIYTLDDILKSDPKRKLLLLCLHFGVLLELKHFEEFKATVIHYTQFFLSDLCNVNVFFGFNMYEETQKHSLFTVLLYLLYFCITNNQYESEVHVLSKISVFPFNGTDYPKSVIKLFFSLLTQLHDGNTQNTLIFTEVLLQIWEDKMDLKMELIHTCSAYLRNSKCFELHGQFLRYHFQFTLSTVFNIRSEYATIAELEHLLFILHHSSKFNERACLNLVKSKKKFRLSFRKYVSNCDERQILCVPGTIEKLGIIWKSDQMLLVHAILVYGTEIIKRDCFERYKQLVIRHQNLLIFELTKQYNLSKITGIYSEQIIFLTLLNLLQHYSIFNQCTNMKRLSSAVLFSFKYGMGYIFSDYISTCDKNQFKRVSLLLQYIWQRIRNPNEKLQCLGIFWKRISELGCTDQFKDFIVDQKHFILSMTDASVNLQLKYKTEYCVLLFHLLREFIMSNNNRDMNRTLMAINNLKHNTLDEFGDSQYSNPNEIDMAERNVFKYKMYNYWGSYRIDEVLNGKLELHEYVRAVINNYNDINRCDCYKFTYSVFKILTYYLQNLNTVQQEKGLIELMASVDILLNERKYYCDINCEISSLIFDIVYSFLVLKDKVDQTKLAIFLLHLNHKCHSELVKKVTVEAGKILQWKTLATENITSEENMVIYKCFCIVRQTKKTYQVQEVSIEEYTSYFNFIEMIDQEEQRQRIIKQTILLLVFLQLITSITSDGHHKSDKLKKYLSLKYAYDDLALYLLWCSGDVEINPGPTFSKIRPMHASEKERRWTYEVCSVLVKLLKELPATSKPKSLWKEKPTCWPQNEPYFDPCNKSKVLNDDLLSDERLFKCLMRCCDEKKICIPEEYRYEINLLSNNNKPLLFETYIFRKEKHNLCEALSNLLMCKDREKINQDTKNCGLTLNFEITQTSQNLIVTKRKGEIITRTRRDLAVMLCKIIKGLNITDKCDGIWKTPPSKWPSDKPFYSPHNQKKRKGICQDTELVDNLIKYCKSNLVVIPPQYQDMVNAWKEGHLDELINFHTIYANIAKLEHSLKILQIEGILSKPDVLDILKKAGLTLDTDTWRLDDVKTDVNQIVSRKRSQNLVVNPITSVDAAVKKLSSCDRGNRQFQKLNVLKKTIEDSRNTLLSSTDKTTVDADSLSPESTSLKLSGSEEFNTCRQVYLNTS